MAQQEDTLMPNAPLTPDQDQDADQDADGSGSADDSLAHSRDASPPAAPVIDYSPASVPYNEAFENSLMAAILSPPSPLPPRTPLPTVPNINPTTLPLPLASPLRTYASPIPGVLLTHANGYHTGGPGPNAATVEAFARRFIEEEGVVDGEGLERAVRRAISERVESVRERMRAREEAVGRNRGVERELEDLRVQRVMEVSVQEKLKAGMKR